jgi:hypothetical protein
MKTFHFISFGEVHASTCELESLLAERLMKKSTQLIAVMKTDSCILALNTTLISSYFNQVIDGKHYDLQLEARPLRNWK